MTLLETLVMGVGASVANATLIMWLKDHEIGAAAAGELSSLLVRKIPDLFKRNDTKLYSARKSVT